MKFIDSYIRNLKPEKKWYEKTEASGLGIRVMPSGNKSWIYRHTFQGKRQKLTLGKYPAVGLKQARDLLLQAQEIKAQGISPMDYQREQKSKETYTVAKLFLDWYETYIVKNRKRPRDVKQQIVIDIIPSLGDKALENLKTIDITETLDRIVKRGAPILANRTLSSFKQALNYATSRGYLLQNPAIGIRAKDIGGHEKPRERVLSLEEIPKIWSFLDGNGSLMSLQTKSAIKIILLTGVRTAELRLAQWSHIDFEQAFWNIPPENNKGSMMVKIHLTKLALSIFQSLKKISDSPYVLPGIDPQKFLDISALPRAIKRIQGRVGIPEWTAHDLRRTFATQLGEALNVDPVVIEKCLGHKMPRIMATYNKNEMLPQRKEALERWSSKIEELVENHRHQIAVAEELCMA